MKIQYSDSIPALLMVFAFVGVGCSSTKEAPPASGTAAPASAYTNDGKSVAGGEYDDLDEYQVAEIPDPLEPVNRVIFVFNDGVYTYLLKPVSLGYKTVVPGLVRQGLRNVFENVRFPIRFVNNLLQAEFERAGLETGKFLLNSVAGVGGIFKPSDKVPYYVDIPPADTGQTFAKWGIPHGCYLVLPIIGPNSPRDTVGLVGNTALNPVSWVGFWYGGQFFAGPDWTVAVGATQSAHDLPERMDIYDAATEDALEKYLAARSAYVQYRAAVAEK